MLRYAYFIFSLLLISGCKRDESTLLRVAVASNFIETAKLIKQAYEADSGQEIQLISGSTGKLIAQISQGAPFDVFLSADSVRAEALRDRQTALYAIGRAVLWCPQGDPAVMILNNQYQKMALANPKHAPYGMVAMQVLKEDVDLSKVVYAENVRQVHHLVKSGAVDLGCVAWSQVMDEPESSISILEDASDVQQRMVLLSEKGQSFYNYILSEKGRRIIQSGGYTLP